MDQRQVNSFSNNNSTCKTVNAFDCLNELLENDCKYDPEVYSHLDLGSETYAKYENAKSVDCEIREALDSRSGTGDSITDADSCLITDVKSPVKKVDHNEHSCNTTPQPKQPSLTELVRTLFSSSTADSFSQSMSTQSPASTAQAVNTDDKFGRENNTYLRDLVRNNRITNAVLDNF